MTVYLDNAATTRTMDTAVEKICDVLKEQYGNPSSLHHKGMEAEREISRAKNVISKILRVDPQEIFFTSGGTESNNLALLGIAQAYNRNGKHIITSNIEHPSVTAALKHLSSQGYEITTLPVNSEGLVDLSLLVKIIRTDTIMVSIMHVNNEIGTIQPIETIGKLVKKCNPKTIFHVDAVQSFGKLAISPRNWNVDCLSLSGHKIYAPKGIGALYISSKIKIKPIIYGGSQQQGIRSGTENTSGIAALGVVSEFMYSNLDTHFKMLLALKKRLAEGILNEIDGIHINGSINEISAPHILNIRFEGIRGEVLLHALESKSIYVSTGSACSSNKPEPSQTLKAIGLSYPEIDSSIRFSLSIYNTDEEIDYCIEQLKEIIPSLKKFARK